MPRPKKQENNEVLQAITSLAEGLKKMEERLNTLEQTKVLSKEDVDVGKTSKTVEEKKEVMPFPPEWRGVIDEILNAKFNATVEYRPDARFELCIEVPKEYSNAKEIEWQMNGRDRRIKVIDNALGTVGVREYAEKIGKNLGEEIMKKVHEGRFAMSAI